MRKNILTCLMAIAAALLTATSLASTKVGTPKVWTVPAVWTADEEVTFYYDVTDVGFPEGADLYLWAWNPSEPDAGNGDNSSDFARLTYRGDNIYTITMVPTEYFGVDKSAFEDDSWAGLWQQLKTKRDDVWSTEFAAPDNRTEIKDFLASGSGVKFYSGSNHSYTEKFNLTQPLSVLFNGDAYKMADGRTLNEIARDPDFVQYGAHSGLSGTYNGEDMDWNPQQTLDVWRPMTLRKTGLKSLGNGLWKWDVETPAEYYSYNWGDGEEGAAQKTPTLFGTDPDAKTDYQCDALKYIIVEVVKDAAGANQWGATSGDQEQKAGTAEAYPDPAFSYFPTRFCALDIVTLIRQYNAKTDGALEYTITAGPATIKGIMDGTRDKRQASVNLMKELAGETSATQLQITITNAKGAVVVSQTIPLVPLSSVE